MIAAHLSFAFVFAGWLTFVGSVVLVAASDYFKPEENL